MTDLSHDAVFTERARHAQPVLLRGLPFVCVFAAAGIALEAGRVTGADADAFDSKLLLLLRFMAVVKFLGVLVAAAVLQWRFRTSVTGPKATVYLVALAAMAAAPGLIWSLGGIALGAFLFHAGLLAFLCLAWKDEAVAISG
jgi:hypothetical protein